MHDQKLLYDLQTQNAFLNMKLDEFIEGTAKSNNSTNNQVRQSRGTNVYTY
jgi:hypothetical protein